MNLRPFLAAALLAVCHSASAAGINYVGSSTVGKFISDAAESYSRVAISLDTRPESSGGEQCAARGSCDIGGVAREVGDKFERQGVVKTLIGKDAIAAVVHKDNPVSGLSTGQLKGMFSGTITNWSQVGGPDLPVKAYIVKKGSATRKVFRQVLMGDSDYQGTGVVTPDARMIATVAGEPGAIGQISFAFLQGQDGVKALAVDGQRASVDNSTYPVTRPLYLVTKGQPAGVARDFIDWAVSDPGQAVVRKRFVGIR